MSILSEYGDKLLANFLALRGGTWDEDPTFRVQDPNLLNKIYIQRLKDIDAAKGAPGTSSEDLSTSLKLNLSSPQIDFVKRMKSAPQP